MRVADLEGATLDYWVAKADGVNQARIEPHGTCTYVDSAFGLNMRAQYSPSTEWAQGGPIIERERMCIEHEAGEKLTRLDPYAYMPDMPNDGQFGRTVLLAAMRCYVALKFGEDVEDAPHNAG